MQQQFTSIFLMVAPNLQPQNQNLIDTWLSLWYKMVNSCTHNSHNLYKWNLAIVRIFSTCLTFLRIAFRISSHQQTQLYQFHGGFQVFFTGLMMRYTESNVLVVSAASVFCSAVRYNRRRHPSVIKQQGQVLGQSPSQESEGSLLISYASNDAAAW